MSSLTRRSAAASPGSPPSHASTEEPTPPTPRTTPPPSPFLQAKEEGGTATATTSPATPPQLAVQSDTEPPLQWSRRQLMYQKLEIDAEKRQRNRITADEEKKFMSLSDSFSTKLPAVELRKHAGNTTASAGTPEAPSGPGGCIALPVVEEKDTATAIAPAAAPISTTVAAPRATTTTTATASTHGSCTDEAEHAVEELQHSRNASMTINDVNAAKGSSDNSTTVLAAKSKEAVQLHREKQQLETAVTALKEKLEEAKAKLSAEKDAHAVTRKAAATERLEAQRSSRELQQSQQRLQRDLEKARAAAAAGGAQPTGALSSSCTTTPMATPRDAEATAAALSRITAEKADLQEKLTLQLDANQALETEVAQLRSAVDAGRRTEQKDSGAIDEAEALRAKGKADAEELTRLMSEVDRLTSALQERETDVAQSQAEGGTAAAPTDEVAEHLLEKLAALEVEHETAVQRGDSAEQRIAVLLAALDSSQLHVAEVEREQNARAMAERETLEGEIKSLSQQCETLQQQLHERDGETSTLQTSLAEVEEERDDYQQQLRQLQVASPSLSSSASPKAAAQLGDLKRLLKISNSQLQQTKRDLQMARKELDTTLVAASTRDHELNQLGAQLEQEEQRSADFLQQLSELQETLNSAALSHQQTVDHLKMEVGHLTEQLEAAKQETAMLMEQQTSQPTKKSDAEDPPALPLPTASTVTLGNHIEAAVPSTPAEVSSGAAKLVPQGNGVSPVSRSLSAALLSAGRRPASAEKMEDQLTEERAARLALTEELQTLKCQVAAMAELEDERHLLHQHPNGNGSAGLSGLSYNYNNNSASTSFGQVAMGPMAQHRAVSATPPRAKSPRSTRALNTRFFDPTAAGTVISTTNEASDRVTGAMLDAATSPWRAASLDGLCHRSTVLQQQLQQQQWASPSLPLTSAPSFASMAPPSSSFADEVFSLTTAPPLYSHFATPPLLVFNLTAGRLLVSRRGRQLQLPLSLSQHEYRDHQLGSVADSRVCSSSLANGDGAEGRSCSALASMSHTIYMAKLAAATAAALGGRQPSPLPRTFFFTIRVQFDPAAPPSPLASLSGSGDVLVGFADRYLPLESFGARRNSLHYRGCYYINFHTGQRLCAGRCSGEKAAAPIDGWTAVAAGAAAARRSLNSRSASDSLSTSPTAIRSAEMAQLPLRQKESRGAAVPEYGLASGDEITCLLQLDEHSISYRWNGMDCGAAFLDIPLRPSLYPAVEINTSGVVVELI